MADGNTRDQPVDPLDQVEEQLLWLADAQNYRELGFLKLVESDASAITDQTKISVRKVVDGFAGFGAQEDGHMVEKFLKGIGSYDAQMDQFYYTTADVKRYINLQRAMPDPMAEPYMDLMIRGI